MATGLISLPDASARLDTPVDLFSTLSTSLHSLLPATSSLHSAALLAAKQILDPLAHDVAQAQELRRSENRRKRKRGQHDGEDKVLQIREVYTTGFGANQIWEQARRVTDAAGDEIDADLRKIAPSQAENGTGARSPPSEGNEDARVKMVRFDEEGFEAAEDEEIESQDEEIEDMDELEEAQDDYGDEDVGNDDIIDDIEISDSDEFISSEEAAAPTKVFIPDPNNLNDGFFSIDDFNKQSQFLEQKDEQGEGDNPSDEDEVDWDANPLSIPLPKKGNAMAEAGNGEESDEAEDGPTFGNADLDASESENELAGEDGEMDDSMSGLGNTNDIKYSDFFEAPPQKPSKTKRMRALPKTQPPPQAPVEDEAEVANDIQRAMADVRRDLLDSDEEASDDEGASVSSNGDRRAKTSKDKNLSTHEKQQAAIAAEIRKLEAAAVAKRDWTLSGEARAADRPQNSLIEEDLEFERAGKPVPVITAEVSESIEALVKRRIVARDFDEVVRRRPEATGSAAETRRGRVELNDAQSKQGLAEIYEEEHLARTDPNYANKLDAKTKKQHAEIDRLWKEVSGQLDVLSNLHFQPKRPEVEIKSVEDKPTIRMEDARPGGAGGEENMLAPQEIFRAGEGGKEGDVVVRKSGASASKEEMTREEKLRRRRRQKERGKKARSNKPIEAAGGDGQAQRERKRKSKKEEKQDILADLRKGNVQVIGKQGRLEDLGKRKKGAGEPASSSAFKL